MNTALFIIGTIISVASGVAGGILQNKESQRVGRLQQEEAKRQEAQALKLRRQDIAREEKRFQQERTDIKEQNIFNRLKMRQQEFGQLLNQNENLKNLLVGRVGGLRKGAA